jgi:hypothetical protein
MFNQRGQVVIKKPYWDIDMFLGDYLIDKADNPESTFILHFRIGTSGKQDKLNTHPHRLTPSCAFVHNGIFGWLNGASKRKSDTVLFRNYYLNGLPKRFWRYPGIKNMLTALCEGHSKMAFLSGDGEYCIINEQSGIWDKTDSRCWFSNSSFRGSPKVDDLFAFIDDWETEQSQKDTEYENWMKRENESWEAFNRLNQRR